MLRSFIQTTSLFLTLGASFFLLKSNLGLTPDLISKFGITYLDYNPSIVRTFAEQASDTRVGFILLLLAFIFQLVNAVWSMRWKEFGANWHGVLIGIGFSLILFTLAHWYSINYSKKMYNRTIIVLDEVMKESNTLR